MVGCISDSCPLKGSQLKHVRMSSELQACVCVRESVSVCILLCKKEKKTRARQGTKVEWRPKRVKQCWRMCLWGGGLIEQIA